MIYLRLLGFDRLFKISSLKLNIVQIENIYIFRKFIETITLECFLSDVITLFDEDLNIIDVDEACFSIINVMNLDLNTKKNLNSLNKILLKTTYENLNKDLENLKKEVLKIVKSISLELEVSVFIKEEIKADDLFKIVDIKFSESQENILEKLINYIVVISKLQRKNIFLILHIKEYLTDEEIFTLIKELSLHEIFLIDFETRNFSGNEQSDNKIIIDEDGCLII